MKKRHNGKHILQSVISFVIVIAMLTAQLPVLVNAQTSESVLEDDKSYTNHVRITATPESWNELNYTSANESALFQYLQSSFFAFDYKFDENGQILPGEFEVEYEAATSLVDVTGQYAADWGLDPEAKGFAYAITLREDLKWDDGTPIKAEDFVYSMQEQLNPLFRHYRADTFYSSQICIAGAESYFWSGCSAWFSAKDVYSVYTEDLDAELVFSLAPPSEEISAECYFRSVMGFPASYDAAACADYVIANYLGECDFTLEIAAEMEGKTFAQIKADPEMKAAWDALIGWWQTEPDEELDFFVAQYSYPVVSFDQVGLFVGENEYELVIILDKQLNLLKEDGTLSYEAAYEFGTLPLVKKDLYEACKIAPVDDSELWTTNYHTSVETTASWSAYKLESFEYGKQYVFTRNEHWFGYQLEENEGLYQTDRIVCDVIEEGTTAWQMFLEGRIDEISLDATLTQAYSGSDRAYFTPNDFIQSAQLQSDAAALQGRESEGINKTILTYTDFRKAMSLAVDRAGYANACGTAAQPAFGIFNEMHYYDVANGGVYRHTDEAKQILCDTYAVDVSQFGSLDEAVDSITGYNLEEARKLVDAAYQQALADGMISPDDRVVLTYGANIDSDYNLRSFDYLSNIWTEMCKGTALEGRITFEFETFDSYWASAFRNGEYDICMGGWSGAAWDPGYFLVAYLAPGYRYAAGWDTSAHMMTFTMKGVAADGGDITETMSLMDWYNCLNGYGQYDWSANALAQEQRLQLIAALEGEILKTYYTVPMFSTTAVSLLSYKVEFPTDVYNTFMGYGGVKYLSYNYSDEEWDALVAAQGGELDYKPGAETPNPEPEPVKPQLPEVSEPVEDVPYKFGMVQVNNGHTVYLDGGIDQDRYLTTTEDKSAAVDIYVMPEGDGFLIYFEEAGACNCITLEMNSAGKVALTYSDVGTVWQYDASISAWYAELDGTVYYMGSYNSYDTISASKIDYINAENAGISQFPAGFFNADDSVVPNPDPDPEPTPDPVEITIAQANQIGASMEHNTFTEEMYIVTGVVTEVVSDLWGNMYITDEEGNTLFIYGFYNEDGTVRYDKLENKPVVGDTVTVMGILGQYNGTVQMKNAWMQAYTAGNVEPKPEPEPVEVTIEDALAIAGAKEHNTYTAEKYIITGVIVEIVNDTYGNLYIADEAGNRIYVYGIYDADGNRFGNMAEIPVLGDTITLVGVLGRYNDFLQMKEAILTVHELTGCRHVNVEQAEGQEATCTEAGYIGDVVCADCGAVIEAGEVIPALGHNEVTDPAKAPTCTENGLTEGAHCERCGEVFVARSEIRALGHSWDEGVVTTEPTAEQEGVKTYTCTVCGETKTKTLKMQGNVLYDLPGNEAVDIPENECFDAGTTVTVDEVAEPETVETVEAAMEDVAEQYVAFEFTATKEDGQQAQPSGKLAVTFAIPEGYSSNVTVYYMDLDGNLHKLEVSVNAGERTITVELEHFSTYILVDEDTAPNALMGDVNGDGRVNARDARALLRYIAGLDESGTVNEAAADFNGDGRINARDARALLRSIAGLD